MWGQGWLQSEVDGYDGDYSDDEGDDKRYGDGKHHTFTDS